MTVSFLSRRTYAAAALGTLLAVAACSSGSGSGSTATSTTPATSSTSGQAVTGTVTVLAAASLTESFTTIAKQFEAAHPGVKITLSFGPSSGLAQSIVAGAPADVFASASKKTMTTVTDAKAASDPTVFVRNYLTIAVPPTNPAHITSLADLAKPGVKVAVCQAQVPCGTVAKAVFDAAKLTVTPVTQEVDVKGVLTKVQLGEVDAGLVYRTDVTAAGSKVASVDLPESTASGTAYPIAVLTAAPNPSGAAAFVAYVLSEQGRSVLTAQGFAAP